ncbi:MAG: type II toxin-antitoxin system HicB family antitoxin [Deltaproteobacteria bacterium]|nr:type II toxin-antitoxin system HicB family antitoxin [Deltaproteobacteria bacterium]
MRYVASVSKEGRRRLVEFPDCPGCQTVAEAGEDVAEIAREALEGWLEAHLVRGGAPPRPKRVRVPAGGLAVTVSPMLAAKVSIRRARLDLGLTQAQLAKRAGLTQAMVARIEDPDYNPTLETLERVARALGAELRISVELP